MKVEKRFIEGLSLLKTPDAPDGSAVAVTDVAQSIAGIKTFADGLKVAQDIDAGDKSLIRKADMDTALADVPGDFLDEITLTSDMITSKSVTLGGVIAEGNEDTVKMTTAGSVDMLAGAWFTASGSTLSWAAFPQTEAVLRAGDKIYVRYIGL